MANTLAFCLLPLSSSPLATLPLSSLRAEESQSHSSKYVGEQHPVPSEQKPERIVGLVVGNLLGLAVGGTPASERNDKR